MYVFQMTSSNDSWKIVQGPWCTRNYFVNSISALVKGSQAWSAPCLSFCSSWMYSKAHLFTGFLKLLVQGPRWATFITDEVGTEFLISDECFFFNKTEASDWLWVGICNRELACYYSTYHMGTFRWGPRVSGIHKKI